jgi:hypothetical protein
VNAPTPASHYRYDDGHLAALEDVGNALGVRIGDLTCIAMSATIPETP